MQIQKIAKTVSLAIDEALSDLDTTIDNIDYEVLQEPSRGFLGMFSKPAKVRITLKSDDDFDSLKEELSAQNFKNVEENTSIVQNEVSEQPLEKPKVNAISTIEKTEKTEQPEKPEKIEQIKQVEQPKKPEKSQSIEKHEKSQKIQKHEKPQEIQKLDTPKRKIPKMVADVHEQHEPKKYKPKNDKKEYDPNSATIAEAFLKQVFKEMGVDIKINVQESEIGHLLIDLKGENVGVVIGKRGQTLDSLQYLVNLVINKGAFAYMSVTIDTEDYRERRRLALENLAINLSKKAKKINRNVNLEPMNPYERRIIHSKLQSDKTIKTYSEGSEPFRYVVISPK